MSKKQDLGSRKVLRGGVSTVKFVPVMHSNENAAHERKTATHTEFLTGWETSVILAAVERFVEHSPVHQAHAHELIKKLQDASHVRLSYLAK